MIVKAITYIYIIFILITRFTELSCSVNTEIVHILLSKISFSHTLSSCTKSNKSNATVSQHLSDIDVLGSKYTGKNAFGGQY